MDLPATQAFDDEDHASQRFEANQSNVVGVLTINNKSHSIESGTTSIGRHPACKIVIDHETVSKKHAEIEAESPDRTIFIKDLKSCNKTKINDTKLKPLSSYQIKDGDKLIFGKVVATFKLYGTVDDSFISSTPQVNRKLRPIIPGTPDSSLNASSASENDISAIPGTQQPADDDICFRRPQLPVKTTNDNIYEMETQRPDLDQVKDSSIYDAVTQKSLTDEQNEELMENLETQQFTDNTLDSCSNKSKNVSIHESSIQKITNNKQFGLPLEDLATQEFVNDRAESDKSKVNDVSIHSAETQKSNDDNLEDFETQQFDVRKSSFNTSKVKDVSIYSAETQKTNDENLEDLETQAFVGRISDFNKSKIKDVSIHSAETQVPDSKTIEDLETQPFISRNSITARKSNNLSMYDAETQRATVEESLEDLETQQLVNKDDHFQIPNLPKRKSSIKPAFSTKETRLSEQKGVTNESMENLETQHFVPSTSSNVTESLNNLETQQFIVEKSSKDTNKSIEDCETQEFTRDKSSKFIANKSLNKSIEDVETQQYELNKSVKIQTPTSIKKTTNKSVCIEKTPLKVVETKVNESIDDLETQEFVSKNTSAIINESSEKMESFELIDKSSEQMSGISFSEEVQTKSFVEKKLSLKKNIQELGESFDNSLHPKEQENNVDNSDTFKLQAETSLKSSSSSPSNVTTEDQSSKQQNEAEQNNSMDEDEDIFCSQNLIKNCPFEIPEESDVNNISTESKKSEENIESKNNKSMNKTSDNSVKSNQSAAKPDDSDSETDEEGVFSNPTPKEDVDKVSKEKATEDDSETDEEGVFSSESFKKESCEKEADKKFKDNSDADEKDMLSKNHTHNSSKAKNNSMSSKNVSIIDESESETDEDNSFSNNLSSKTESNKTVQNEEKASEIVPNRSNFQKSPTPDSEDNIFDEEYKDKVKSEHKLTNTSYSNRKSFVPDEENKQLKNTNPNVEVDEFAPTQLIDTEMAETENIHLAPTQIINQNDTDNEFLVPLQTRNTNKLQTPATDDLDDLAPTQIIPTDESQTEKASEVFDDLDLAPTQKIDTQFCTESLAPTQIIERLSCAVAVKPRHNVSIEDEDYEMAPTQIIGEIKTPTTSKRQTVEIEITCAKRSKIGDFEHKKIDLNSTVEKDLHELFEGAEEVGTVENEQSVLSEKLENILESSPAEHSKVNLNSSISQPSPSLGTRRNNCKSKNRRRAMCHDKSNTSNQSVVNLNDTIERNLKEMFDSSIPDEEEAESTSMMTQQLKNVLESQEDVQSENTETDERKSSPDTSINPQKKKGRLSLNMSISTPSKNKDDLRNSKTPSLQLSRNKSTSEESSHKKDAEKCSAGEKLTKKLDVILDSQSDEENSDSRLSNDKDIVYRRGLIGYMDDLEPVSTFDRLPFVVAKGQTLTSDSQSDAEELDKGKSRKSPKFGGKRRGRSLAKNVSLNASTASSVGRSKLPNKLSISKSPLLSEKAARSTRRSTSSTPKVARRVPRRGTRGFDNDLKAHESEELVSATSTESDEDRRPPTRDRDEFAIRSSQPSTSKTPEKSFDASQQNDEDEDDLFVDLPEVKIAGTLDCPATNSQLAAPSDNESEESADIVIPYKWTWYANKRYDLIDREIESGAEKKPVVTEVRAKTPPDEKIASVDEILAEIESTGKPISDKRKSTAVNEWNGKISTRSRRRTQLKKSSSDSDDDSAEDNHSKAETPEDGSDSDETSIIPKYVPLSPNKINMRFKVSTPSSSKAMEEEILDEIDQEFVQIRRECARMLAVQSSYASVDTKKKKIAKSPPLTTTRRRGKRALSITRSNSSSQDLDTDRAIADKPAKRRTAANEDTVAFQVSTGESSMTTSAPTPTTTTTASRMSALSVIRNKRSVATTCPDDTQNQPPKRTKTSSQPSVDRVKTQQLSVVISPLRDKLINMPADIRKSKINKILSAIEQPAAVAAAAAAADAAKPVEEKTSVKAPKTLESYVVLHKPSRTDSSDLSAVENSMREDKKRASIVSSRTRGRLAAPKKAKADGGSSNSSKENVVVEDSDVESESQKSRTRGGRTRKNQVVPKDSSKSEISSSESESVNKGRSTRQKKTASAEEVVKPKKVVPALQDSDSEDAEFAVTKHGSFKDSMSQSNVSSELKETTKQNESQKSETVKKSTRGRKVKDVKSSDSEEPSNKLEKDLDSQKEDISKDAVNVHVRINRIKDTPSSQESENSDNTRSTRRRNVKKPALEESEATTNSDSQNIRMRRGRNAKISNSEESEEVETTASKSTRSRRLRNPDSEPEPTVDKGASKKLDDEVKGPEPTNEVASKVTKRTRTRKASHNDDSDSQLDIAEMVKKRSRNTRAKNVEEKPAASQETRSRRVKNVELEKSETVEVTQTRKKRGQARNKSPASVVSESSDNEKEKNESQVGKSSRPARQTRKRGANVDKSASEPSISAESQEAADILKNSIINDSQTTTRTRRGRAAKNVSKSQEAESSDDVFEKPVSRPKRAKLNKSAKTKSLLEDSQDSEINESQESVTSRKRNTPSPTPLSQSLLTPSRIRRSISTSPFKGSHHKVLFTGERTDAHRNIVTKLGGSEIEDPSKCTILVTDKVRRTFKFLCSLARGIPIVSVNWLNDSKKANYFLDWEDYILKDPEAESKFKFNLESSLEKAKEQKLLEGYAVLLTPKISQPPVSELKDMIISSGGKPLLKAPLKWLENTVVVTKVDDMANAKKFMAKAPKSVSVHTTEFILTGILRQDINMKEFKLSI